MQGNVVLTRVGHRGTVVLGSSDNELFDIRTLFGWICRRGEPSECSVLGFKFSLPAAYRPEGPGHAWPSIQAQSPSCAQ